MKNLLLLIPVILLAGCTITLSEDIASDYDRVAVSEETTLEYRIYLPPQYEEEPDREFPLLVYFHGGGGDHRTWGQEGGLGERLLPKMANEDFGPFIVMAPSVGRFDVITGEAERQLFDEVIPRVKRDYRTCDTTIGFGHSMGGLSVLMLSMRHPEVFDAVAAASPFAYDLSPFDEQSRITEFEQTYGDNIFVGRWTKGVGAKFETESQFDAYSPFEQIRDLRRELPFALFLTTGTEDYMGLYPQNRILHEELKRAGVPHDYLVQEGVSHSTLGEPKLYKWIHAQAAAASLNQPPNAGPVTRVAGGN